MAPPSATKAGPKTAGLRQRRRRALPGGRDDAEGTSPYVVGPDLRATRGGSRCREHPQRRAGPALHRGPLRAARGRIRRFVRGSSRPGPVVRRSAGRRCHLGARHGCLRPDRLDPREDPHHGHRPPPARGGRKGSPHCRRRNLAASRASGLGRRVAPGRRPVARSAPHDAAGRQRPTASALRRPVGGGRVGEGAGRHELARTLPAFAFRLFQQRAERFE